MTKTMICDREDDVEEEDEKVLNGGATTKDGKGRSPDMNAEGLVTNTQALGASNDKEEENKEIISKNKKS